VTVFDGLAADAVTDSLQDLLVVLFCCCFAQNVMYSLRWIYCKAKDAVYFWRVPEGCAAEAVCDVMCLSRLPLNVEAVDGEVLPSLLAPCIANLIDLFTPDAEEWPMIGPDCELLHAKEVVSALFDSVLDCKRIQLDYGVGLLGWVETARSASHQSDSFLPVDHFRVHQRKA
jgi:hypothetical protein